MSCDSARHIYLSRPASTLASLGDDRKNNFDLIRIVLALTVLYSHCYPLTYGNNSLEPLYAWTNHGITLGTLSVLGFFFLSGYLISASWVRSRSLGAYLKKRCLRILPGYIVVLFIGLLIITPLYAVGDAQLLWTERLSRFVKALLTLRCFELPEVFADSPFAGTMNGSLWTIRYEFACYLFLGCLGCFVRIFGGRGSMLSFFVVAVILLVMSLVKPQIDSYVPSYLPTPSGFFILAPAFFLGALAYRFRAIIPSSIWLAIVAICFLIVSLSRYDSEHGWYMHWVVCIAGGYLLLYLANIDWELGQSVTSWGDPSYGIYIYAFPIQQILVASLLPPMSSPLALFFLALPVVLVCAMCSWLFIEKPALGWGRSRPRPNAIQSEVNVQVRI